MFSVVVLYKDECEFQDFKTKLYKQSECFELIAVDNTKQCYRSVAEAYNYGGMQATQSNIIFMHCDVELDDPNFLAEAETYLCLQKKGCLAGVAGMSAKPGSFAERSRNVIDHGYPVRRKWGTAIKSPEEVQTVDDCFIIVPRELFQTQKFDEVVCSDWHFYVTDYCLEAGVKGLKVMVLPLPIYHRSDGGSGRTGKFLFWGIWAIDSGYIKTLQKIVNKYKGVLPEITNTSGIWNTSEPIWWQRVKKGLARRFMRAS